MLDEHLESAGMLANVFPAVEALGDAICEALGNGNQIITFGNGGSAENVLRGLRAGHDAGAVTALLTGDAGTQGTDGVDHLVGVPSSSTSRIQELHLIVVHLLCEIVDAWAMDQGGASTRPRPKASAAAPSRPARSPSSAGRTSRSRTN